MALMLDGMMMIMMMTRKTHMRAAGALVHGLGATPSSSGSSSFSQGLASGPECNQISL
jgi:hypothetical protein